jgi:glycosyltransferase involved in cell wall biosynthesis
VNRWIKLRHFLRRWRLAWRLTGRERFDAVQARDMLDQAIIAWSVARLRRTSFTFQLDGMHFEGWLCMPWGRGLRPKLMRLGWRVLIRVRDALIRRADLLFVLTEEMRKLYIAKGVRPERCIVFPVGTGPAFLDAPDERVRMREELGVGETPAVVYLGNIAPPREAGFILEILGEIARRRPDVRILLLSQNSNELDALLDSYGLRPAIACCRAVPYEDVPRYLAAADVGIYPIPVDVPFALHTTMSPLKVAEYLATGVPVVASPVPEVCELLAASRSGVIVENGKDEFAEAAIRLLDRPSEAREMGRRGREYIRTYKSFAVLAEVVERAYLSRRPA